MPSIVLASGNAGKIRELSALLHDMQLNVLPQTQFGIPDAVEDGLSFIENALIKARHAARLTGLPALADDSGIEVTALRGAPGIYSARYAGEPSNDTANNRKLLAALHNFAPAQRQARYYCVLAFVLHADDPTPLIAEGWWNGYILDIPRGTGGFGYDPLFFCPQAQCSAAEMDADTKARYSHRAKALSVLRDRLPEKWQYE